MLWLTLLHKLDTTTEGWPDFTDSTGLLRPACLWSLLAAQLQTLQWSSKVCIQHQSLLSRTVRVRRQLNLTGGTAS